MPHARPSLRGSRAANSLAGDSSSKAAGCLALSLGQGRTDALSCHAHFEARRK